MNLHDEPDFDPRIAAWLEDDPANAPAKVLETVLSALPSIPQRRAALRVPWRYSSMITPARFVAGIGAAVAITLGGLILIGRTPIVGNPSTPTTAPSPTVQPNGPLDGTSWTTQIARSDTPAGVPEIAVGTWTLDFIAAPGYGTTMFLGNPRGGGPNYRTTYLSANEVAFPADPACASEDGKPTASGMSTYRYAITGSMLVFTLVTTENCTARIANLTAHPWAPSTGASPGTTAAP